MGPGGGALGAGGGLGALAGGGAVVLDGPTGTELEARGYRSHPVLWTAAAAAEAPALLTAVHRDYLDAGAHVLTANTFRTTASRAQQAGIEAGVARAWLRGSVACARAAIATFAAAHPDAGPRLVAGSLAPWGDCYRPDETPDPDTLRGAHARTAAQLVAAGCDLVLVETQGTAREAGIAVAAAVAAGAPAVLVSFLPAPDGVRLLSGDPLYEAAGAALSAGAAGVLVNCAHAKALERALEALAPLRACHPHPPVLWGAYANAGHLAAAPDGPRFVADVRPIGVQIADYAARCAAWTRRGVQIVGGCCGMSPAFVRAVAAAVAAPPALSGFGPETP